MLKFYKDFAPANSYQEIHLLADPNLEESTFHRNLEPIKWTFSHDQRLIQLMQGMERCISWPLLTAQFNQEFQTRFPASYLQSRWETYLKFSIPKNKSSFTLSDNLKILEFVRKYGRKWVKLKDLKRNSLVIAAHWRKHLRIHDHLSWKDECYDSEIVRLIYTANEVNWILLSQQFNQIFQTSYPPSYLQSRWETYLRDSFIEKEYCSTVKKTFKKIETSSYVEDAPDEQNFQNPVTSNPFPFLNAKAVHQFMLEMSIHSPENKIKKINFSTHPFPFLNQNAMHSFITEMHSAPNNPINCSFYPLLDQNQIDHYTHDMLTNVEAQKQLLNKIPEET